MSTFLLNPYRFAVLNAYAATVLADSPVGYWKLDETTGTAMVDSSGNGMDGTYLATPTLGVAGQVGTAVTFNGSSQYGNVAQHAILNVDGDFSVEAWIKHNGNPAAHSMIAAKYGGINLGTGWILLLATTGTVQFDGRSGGAYRTSGPSSVTVVDNQWHHIVGCRRGSVWEIWVDGSLGSSADVANASTVAVAKDVRIARNTDTTAGAPAFWFGGSIDEVALYDEALSSTRIAAHHAAGSA